MNDISKNLKSIRRQLKTNVQLIAVSKLKPNSDIIEAYNEGQRLFGENYVQELVEKHAQLPKDIQWHLIGHLQRNKVKYIIEFVACIQGIDNEKLLFEVNKQAEKHNRIVDCLLQFHIAQEETKFGFSFDEAQKMLQNNPIDTWSHVHLCGIMGMASFTDNKELITKEFKQLKTYFDLLKQNYFSDKDYFKEISMGMTNDFDIAQQQGSTMVRIGSAIFGKR